MDSRAASILDAVEHHYEKARDDASNQTGAN